MSLPPVKRILVTGANKGIGKALCLKLLTDYADTHVLLGSRDLGRGELALTSILQELGDGFKNRIEVLLIDVSNDTSVLSAAQRISDKFGSSSPCLYGIVNNAALGFINYSLTETLETNLYGTIRTCNAFLPLIEKGGNGRIVNVSSAAGPMYVASLEGAKRALFVDPDAKLSDMESLASQAISSGESNFYGLSKACVNLYTLILAKMHPELKINSCTPGFIATDMTKDMGATHTPEQGTKSPLYCLFDANTGTGKYFGSDAVRSPLDKYRNPGDPPFEP